MAASVGRMAHKSAGVGRAGTMQISAARIAAWVLKRRAHGSGRIRRLPLAGGWTASRDLPAPEGETFQAQWARRR